MATDSCSLELAEKRAEIAEVRSLLSQSQDMVRWGSWTVAAELAEKAAVVARSIRKREMDDAVRQEELRFPDDKQRTGTLFAFPA